MKKERRSNLELALIVLGPVGFIIFLLLHFTDNQILKELEEDMESRRGAHGGMATFWTIICLVFLLIVTSPSPPGVSSPRYDLIEIEGQTVAGHIRYIARVCMEDFTEERAMQVAEDVRKRETPLTGVHSVAVFFYDNKETEAGYEKGAKCYGKAIYGPNGEWDISAKGSKRWSYDFY